eukprot:11491092-Alexandrium_andersonii.AAC.1
MSPSRKLLGTTPTSTLGAARIVASTLPPPFDQTLHADLAELCSPVRKQTARARVQVCLTVWVAGSAFVGHGFGGNGFGGVVWGGLRSSG